MSNIKNNIAIANSDMEEKKVEEENDEESFDEETWNMDQVAMDREEEESEESDNDESENNVIANSNIAKEDTVTPLCKPVASTPITSIPRRTFTNEEVKGKPRMQFVPFAIRRCDLCFQELLR